MAVPAVPRPTALIVATVTGTEFMPRAAMADIPCWPIYVYNRADRGLLIELPVSWYIVVYS